ncbi:uncharacterized protein LOC124165930 [Ischnura elegans]|uniref:uncharacterized protein LOC124165930 n=1 Tax=Ischnura elegans TaxID=197161 RepID=UPI001ED8B9E5|nr:uncharacterized protein LOC124165930 [Ischnura elegans]
MATRRRRRSFPALFLPHCLGLLLAIAQFTPRHRWASSAAVAALMPEDAAATAGGDAGNLGQHNILGSDIMSQWPRNNSIENELIDSHNSTLGGGPLKALTSMKGPKEALDTTTTPAPPMPTTRPLPPLLRVLLRTTTHAPGSLAAPLHPHQPGDPLPPSTWYQTGRNADYAQVANAANSLTTRSGPYFEEGADGSNVTARLGSTVLLDCKIGMLRDKTVTWIHRRNDAIHLLTVGLQAYSSDSRFSLAYRYPSNWRLQILFVTRRDEGLYECQVATHPPRIRQIFLRVTAPEVKIVDEDGHEVLERYYKAGSQVELSCLATQLEREEGSGEPPADADGGTESGSRGAATNAAGRVVWRHGDAAITRNTSGRGIWMNSSADGLSASVTLTLTSAKKFDGGNYTCSADGQASATVSIHILNGELPAAVQYGNSTVPFGAVNILLHLLCLVMSVGTLTR